MSAGPVVDRVYAGLRERLLRHRYRPGERLEIAQLCTDLASSNTPVRDALNRLVGEGLVATPGREGFNVPVIDEPSLTDLYLWSCDLLRLAVAGSRRWTGEPGSPDVGQGGYATRTAAVFERIAGRSGNLEHARAVENCSARLSAARTVEPEIFADAEVELAELATLFAAGEPGPLRHAIGRYHARRVQRATVIVRLLYRAPSQG